MDRERIHSFIETAETVLMSVRGSLLLSSQGVQAADLDSAGKQLDGVIREANGLGFSKLAAKAHECRQTLVGTSPGEALLSLDRVAAVEAELLGIDLGGAFDGE